MIGSSDDPRTDASATGTPDVPPAAVPPGTDPPPTADAGDGDDHVGRLLETVSALAAAQAEQAHDLSRLLDVLERLTGAQEDTVRTLELLEARIAELGLRVAAAPPADDAEPLEPD